MTLMQPTIRTN